MKRLTLSVLFACLAMFTFAQNDESKTSDNDLKTLFGSGTKTTIGWFVGPAGGYTKFCNSDVALAGIHAGMVINHNFTIGLTGFGAGISYRYTPDLNMVNTSTSFINNFTTSASLKFGKF